MQKIERLCGNEKFVKMQQGLLRNLLTKKAEIETKGLRKARDCLFSLTGGLCSYQNISPLYLIDNTKNLTQ